MKDGIGKGYTREDHPDLSSQIFASYSRVQEVRSLASVVGEDELSKTDKAYLAFGEAFEKQFLMQGKEEDREIGESLDIAWQLLGMLPRAELTRVTMDEIRKYIDRKKW